MSDGLLVLWVALIGADRIDLAGGHGAFFVTPFLALTPLVIVSELMRRVRHGTVTTLSRNAVAYAAVSACLLGVVLTSTLLSDEVLVSGSRSALLLMQMTGTFAVAVLISDRRDLARMLARGALLSLPLFVFCDIMEGLWLLGRGPELLRVGSATLKFRDIQLLGALPRPGGPVIDSNRAGFVLVCYIVMLSRGVRNAGLRRVAIGVATLLLIATVSRSAALAAIATLAMSVASRPHRVFPRTIAIGLLGLSLMTVAVWLNPQSLRPVQQFANSTLASRVSLSEGSGHDHLELLERGIAAGDASVSRSLIGIGYGDSYLVLQDMFPGDTHGNFHSLYVSMFAESGIVALLLVVILLGAPMARGGPWRPLVAGAVAFNFFYQTSAEPTFWFVLAMAWLAMPPGAISGEVRTVPLQRPAPSA